MKRTMHLSRCALESDYSFTVVKVLAFLIALFLLSDLVTAYCYENVTIHEMGYLAKSCSAAAEVWPGDGPGPHFFEREVHISEM